MQRLGRMKHEMSTLKSTAMTGISVWNVEDDLFHLQAQILGDDSSPYKGGVFKLEIRVPDRYPFEPPHVKFLTPIYHPNIDAGGRICLDVLKMPPKGSWKPSSNIRTVLLSIQLLMNEPNPDDPLMEDISQQYKSDRHLFRQTAIRWTQRHAVQTTTALWSGTAKNQDCTDLDNLDHLEAAKKGKENEDKRDKENRKDAKENENGTAKDILKDNPATKSDLDLPGSEKHSSNVGRGMTTTSTTPSTTSSSTSFSITEKSSSITNAGAAMKLSLKPSLSCKQSSSSSSKQSSSSSAKQSSSSSANQSSSSSAKQSSSSKSRFTSSKTSLTKPISAGPVKDIFDESFEEEEDDDFVNQTPEKNKKKVGANDDLFDEMNDSDLDLFDFDETPEKKKKKVA